MLVCINLAVLVLWSTESIYRTISTITAASLTLMGAFTVCYLSYFEHSRTICPSSFLNLYLLLSLILDLIQARSLLHASELHALMLVYIAGICVKLLVLILEAQSKHPYLKPAYQALSPEVTAGIINRTLFWWINSLFQIGYRKLLTYQDLPVLDEKLSSEPLRLKLQYKWFRRRESSL